MSIVAEKIEARKSLGMTADQFNRFLVQEVEKKASACKRANAIAIAITARKGSSDAEMDKAAEDARSAYSSFQEARNRAIRFGALKG